MDSRLCLTFPLRNARYWLQYQDVSATVHRPITAVNMFSVPCWLIFSYHIFTSKSHQPCTLRSFYILEFVTYLLGLKYSRLIFFEKADVYDDNSQVLSLKAKVQ